MLKITKKYIEENDVDLNDNQSLGFHLEELIAIIQQGGLGPKDAEYKIAKDLYHCFNQVQPL